MADFHLLSFASLSWRTPVRVMGRRLSPSPTRPVYLNKRTRWPAVGAPGAGAFATGRRRGRQVCLHARRNSDGAELAENLGVSVGSAIRGVRCDGKMTQSNQLYAPDRRRRFYLAIRCSVPIAPNLSPPNQRPSTPGHDRARPRSWHRIPTRPCDEQAARSWYETRQIDHRSSSRTSLGLHGG